MVDGPEAHGDNRRLSFLHPVLVATLGYPPLGGGSSTIMKNLLDHFEPGSIVLAVQRPLARKETGELEAGPHRRHFVVAESRLPGRLEVRRRTILRPLVRRRLTRLARRYRCGAIVGVYPDVFFLDSAVRAATDLGLPFLPYLHDTIVESLEGSRYDRLGHQVQERVVRSAHEVLVATHGMAALFREKYGIEAVPVEHIYPEPVPEQPPEDPGSRDLFWSGNIYAINAAALRRVFDASGLVDGTGLNIASLQSQEGLERLGFGGARVRSTYIPVSERSRYLDLLKSHGVLVLALSWPDESSIHEDELRTIFPTKTPEYLASGRPILVHCPDHYYLAQFFKENGCGEVVGERSVDALATALNRLLEDPARRLELGRAALTAAHQFAPEIALEAFHRSVRGALGGA
jgi:Glycosyl transferase 4-like domain